MKSFSEGILKLKDEKNSIKILSKSAQSIENILDMIDSYFTSISDKMENIVKKSIFF